MDFKGAFECVSDDQNDSHEQRTLKETLFSAKMDHVPPLKRAELAKQLLIEDLKKSAVSENVVNVIDEGIDDLIHFIWSYCVMSDQ